MDGCMIHPCLKRYWHCKAYLLIVKVTFLSIECMQIVLVSSFFPWQSFKVQRCPIIPQRMEIPFFTVLILLWLVSNTCYDCRPVPPLFVQKQCLQCMLKRCVVPVLSMVGSSLVLLPHLLPFKSISKSISNLLQKK